MVDGGKAAHLGWLTRCFHITLINKPGRRFYPEIQMQSDQELTAT